MIRARRLRQLFFEIRRQAGDPPIPLVSWEVASRWREDEAKGVMGYCLYMSKVAVNPAQSIACAKNTIWHEIGHVLFPRKPHWWIYTYAALMSRRDNEDQYISDKREFLSARAIGGKLRHYPYMFPLQNGFPRRRELLKMTKAASERYRAKLEKATAARKLARGLS